LHKHGFQALDPKLSSTLAEMGCRAFCRLLCLVRASNGLGRVLSSRTVVSEDTNDCEDKLKPVLSLVLAREVLENRELIRLYLWRYLP
jgi:hypothetical protein